MRTDWKNWECVARVGQWVMLAGLVLSFIFWTPRPSSRSQDGASETARLQREVAELTVALSQYQASAVSTLLDAHEKSAKERADAAIESVRGEYATELKALGEANAKLTETIRTSGLEAVADLRRDKERAEHQRDQALATAKEQIGNLASADVAVAMKYIEGDSGSATRKRLAAMGLDEGQRLRFYVTGLKGVRKEESLVLTQPPEPITPKKLDAFYADWCHVTVTSSPETGGTITFDSVAWGTTNTDGFLRRGKYTLRVEKPECVPVQMEVEVLPDRMNNFPIQLDRTK